MPPNDYFVNEPPVPIYEFEPGSVLDEQGHEAQPNIIWIRSRMDVETDGKVNNAMFPFDKEGKRIEARLGDRITALLIYNIVKWDGPVLGRVKCTPENIRKLSPNQPHIAKVLEEIAERNKKPESPDPNSLEANGSMSVGDLDSMPSLNQEEIPIQQLVTGRSASSLRNAITGIITKSENSTPSS